MNCPAVASTASRLLLAVWLLLVAAPLAGATESAVDDAASSGDDAVPVFDVWEYQVSGNTVLAPQDIERAVYPHLGEARTIDDVEAARTALESRYRAAGFGTVLVNIPEQDVEGGVVALEVIEGRVERLRVTGSRYFSLGRIRAQVPSIAPGELPRLTEVQRELATLNRASADRSVTPILRPGRAPGAVEIELAVEDELPLHGTVELNDRFTRDTTRTRVQASLRYDNLWQREHSLGISYQVSPEDRDEVEVFSGTYLFRPAYSDLLVALYGVRSNSDVSTGSAGGPIGVIGKGTIGGVRIIRPLPVVANLFHNLTFGLDYKDFEDTIAPAGGGGFETPISFLKFVAGYGGFAAFDAARLRYNLDLHAGPRAFGNTEKEFENKRFQAKPNFLYLRTGSTLTLTDSRDVRYVVDFAGQIASGPLVSNEQFSLGGLDSVRGYVETQRLVDDVVQGRFEIISPSLHALLGAEVLSELRLRAFLDAARGRILEPLPGQADTVKLAGAGLGLSLSHALGFDSQLDWAWPLSTDGNIRPGESRLHFGFSYAF